VSVTSEWPTLGRALGDALKLARELAPSIVEQALLERDTQALIDWIARQYLQGRSLGYIAHGAHLRLGRFVRPNVLRAWVDAAQAYGNEWTTSLLTQIDDAGAPTRMWLENRVRQTGEQGVWRGNDDVAREAAVLAEAEFKVWVRAWPREETRDWHDQLADDLGGIPVEAQFRLPGGPNAGALVDGPRDWVNVPDPAEHMHCGHALRYEMRVTGEDLQVAREQRGVLYDPRPRR
jgi:hypothetical protein